MIYFREKTKEIKEMSAHIVEFVSDLEEKLRENVSHELLDEEAREGITGAEYEKRLPGIRRDARRIAEDIRVQAFDLARKMVIEGVQDHEQPKSKTN